MVPMYGPPASGATAGAGSLDLRRSLQAVWAGGTLPPTGAARDLLAHVTSGRW